MDKGFDEAHATCHWLSVQKRLRLCVYVYVHMTAHMRVLMGQGKVVKKLELIY